MMHNAKVHQKPKNLEKTKIVSVDNKDIESLPRTHDELDALPGRQRPQI